jgi:large conductance mechanosensitive channel
VLLAAVVYYFVVVPVSRLMDRMTPLTPTTTRECPFCLSKIPVKARRCAFCTSDVEDRVQTAIDELTSRSASS